MTSILKVSTIQDPTNSNTAISIDATGKVTAPNLVMPAGSVIQVKSVTKTDTFSAALTMTDIPGLSLSITPASASSKILVIAQVHIHGNNAGCGVRLLRGSTELGLGNAAGSRTRLTMIGQYGTSSPDQYSAGANHLSYLDAPSTTSATTYKLQGGTVNGSTFVVNQTWYDLDNNNASRGSSTLTLMEIAG